MDNTIIFPPINESCCKLLPRGPLRIFNFSIAILFATLCFFGEASAATAFTGDNLGVVRSKNREVKPLKISGYVFNDLNKNGVLDLAAEGVAGEKGVSGVAVSDGYCVAVTDAEGKYSIEINPDAHVLNISVPSYYKSRGDFYRGLEEIKKRPNIDKKRANGPVRVDFALEEYNNQPRKFVHLSDTEARIYKDWVDEIKDYAAENEAAFILFSGDICYEKGLKLHRDYLNSKALGITSYFTVGNHDLVDGDYGEQLYEQCFGPAYYSFNAAGVHFLSLPVPFGDKKTFYDYDKIYAWMKKDLSLLPEGTPIIIFCHMIIGYDKEFNMIGKTDSIEMKRYNLKGYIYGHHHVNLANTTKNGVRMFCTCSPNKGGTEHTPSSYRVLTFDEKGNIRSELRYSNFQNSAVAIASRADKIERNGIGGKEYSSCATHISSIVYDTSSDTKSATVVAPDGSRYPLVQKGAMVREGVVPVGIDDFTGYKLEAVFANGDKVIKRIENRRGLAENKNVSGYLNVEKVISTGAFCFFAEPVISSSTIYMGAADDDNNERCGIYAFDREKESLKWFFKTDNSVKNRFVLDNGAIFVCDVMHQLYSINAATGKLNWRVSLQDSPQQTFNMGVCVNNGMVYAGAVGSLKGVDTATGKIIWKSAWHNGIVSVADIVVKQGILLSIGYWRGRFALNSKTGEVIWSLLGPEQKFANSTPILASKKEVHVATNDIIGGVGYDGSGRVGSDSVFVCIGEKSVSLVEPETGKILKNFNLPGEMYVNGSLKPVIYDSLLIFGTANEGVVALDMSKNFAQAWNFKTNPSRIYTVPYSKDFQQTVTGSCLIIGGICYFGANDGYLYAVEAKTGIFVNRLNLGVPILAGPVSAYPAQTTSPTPASSDGEVIYINDFAGRLIKLKLSFKSSL